MKLFNKNVGCYGGTHTKKRNIMVRKKTKERGRREEEEEEEEGKRGRGEERDCTQDR